MGFQEGSSDIVSFTFLKDSSEGSGKNELLGSGVRAIPVRRLPPESRQERGVVWVRVVTVEEGNGGICDIVGDRVNRSSQ